MRSEPKGAQLAKKVMVSSIVEFVTPQDNAFAMLEIRIVRKLQVYFSSIFKFFWLNKAAIFPYTFVNKVYLFNLEKFQVHPYVLQATE